MNSQKVERTASLLSEIKQEFPRFSIIAKEKHLLSKIIDRLLKLITFGGQDRFLTGYHTVLGSTLYVAPTWEEMDDNERYVLLRHERVHLRQRRRLTFVGMAFVYLVPLFPLGLAYGRARLEWEAYQETLRARAEVWGMAAVRDPDFRRHIVERFISADYGWMWPFPHMVEGWYDAEITQLESNVGDESTL